MQKTPYEHFRFRVLSLDAGHHPTSRGLVDDIRHADASSGLMLIAL